MNADLKRLQGTWAIASLEVEGQEVPASGLTGARIVIEGDRFTNTGMGHEYAGTLELNTKSKPCGIDMHFDAGPEKGNTNLGIYAIEGDGWKLCLATRGNVRPAEFAAPVGSGFAFEVLTRASDAAETTEPLAAKAAAAAVGGGTTTEFEGEWSMVSGVMDGSAMDPSLMQWVRRITEGNLSTVYAGPNVMLKVEFSTDATASPKAVEYRNLAGSHKGKQQHGIYELAGGVLTVCIAAPGAPRPSRFESVKGDGSTLTVWKRK